MLQLPGVMALGSVLVCLIFGEHYAVGAFLWTAVVSVGTGQVLYRLFRAAAPMRVSHAMVTAVLSWASVSVLGALPFVLVGSTMTGAQGVTTDIRLLGEWWNAIFESVSGFTSTGLTMTTYPSELPHCLQWWRSLSQWIGGVGIIVLTVSVFHPSEDARRLYFAEVGRESPVADIAAVARGIWRIYLVYTLTGIVGLRLSGLAWWEAVNYGMAGITTGGFGVEDNSMATFPAAAQVVMGLLMVLGAISFAVHRRVVNEGKLTAVWRDSETRTFLSLLVVGALLLMLENRWSDVRSTPFGAIFQWTSALATAGFSTEPLQPWSPGAKMLMCLAMMCGGAAGATTGGLRVRRVVRLVQGASARISGVARHPWRLMEHKPIADPEAERHAARQLEASVTMLVLWLATMLGGVWLLLHAVGPDVRLEDVIFEVSSALNNVGLTTGMTSPDLPNGGKLGLMLLMFVGRLEIVPILVLAAIILKGHHRR